MIAATAIAVTNPAPAAPAVRELHWSQLPPLPDRLGVAGAFAGESRGALLVGGGANFPDTMPWAGGKKVWHDTVYALEKTNGAWRVGGSLPRPLAYGVSLTTSKGVICIGGSDADRHYADVFLLSYFSGKADTESWPSLPVPLANAAGAVVEGVVYVCGGTDQPGEKTALGRFFALDIDKRGSGWRELEPCPGEARILAVAASARGAFYLVGGTALRPANGVVKRHYLRDAWRFSPAGGWERLPDLPKPCVAAATPAPVVNLTLYLMGGDDGSLAGFQPPEKHPGFPKTILALDLSLNRWTQCGEVPASRATLPVVEWNELFVLPSGEMRPGVRSPEVWTFSANGR